MKNKILAIAATAGLGLASATSNAQELETNVTVGLESQYVFRGIQLADDSAQGSVSFAYGDAYLGIWTTQPLEKEFDSEIDFFAGYQYLLNDQLTLDVGGTVYYYPEANGAYDRDTTEFYLGLSANTPLDPRLYVYYDVDLDVFTTEGALTKSFALDEKSSIDLTGALGWVKEEHATDYFYYAIKADYVYNFTETMRGSIGARAGGNDDGRGPGGEENTTWAGFSFSADF